jgi:hypothetical protein
MSVQDALSRVVGLFGPQATWDPTKLYGNLMVSPNGNVLIKTTTDDKSVALNIAGAAKTQALTIDYGSNYATLYFGSTGKTRWTIYKENTAESGSNAGSNFGLNAVADDGSTQTQVIGINRASFLTTIYKGLSLQGNLSTTGNMVQTVTGTTDLLNYMNGPAGHYKGIYFQTGSNARWLIMSDNTAETGSNAGSNFSLSRYTDAGVWIDNTVSINRANAGIALTGAVQSSNAGSGTGVYRSTGDIGTSWANWSGSSTAALQVDAANSASQYIGVRWTRWAGRHIAAVEAYEGGTSTSTCQINFAFPGNANSHIFYDGGSATFAGALTQNSDYRIKTNVEALGLEETLARVMKLRPTEYDRTDHESHGRQPGFIAHEVQDSFPLLVKGEKDAMHLVKRLIGDLTPHAPGEEPEEHVAPTAEEREEPALQSVNYVGMIPYLTAAIQALNNRLVAQATEIEQLKQRLH